MLSQRLFICLALGMAFLGLCDRASGGTGAIELEFDQPPHDYWKRPLRDPVTRLKADLESGRLALDGSSERAFLTSLLKALNVPASSQLLVFSTTSLQLRFISPANPRALYFNEDVHVGYIPGGRVEVVSLDPDVGGVFYIFDIPRDTQSLRLERSDRCMNCHVSEDTGDVPGLIIRSVLPGPSGGSLKAFRIGRTGHNIPFTDRFGGWYVTGEGTLTNHWGNLIGRSAPAGSAGRIIPPGSAFDFARYPAPTSDLLAHLLHEHQVGFVNRLFAAIYHTRAALHADQGRLTPDHAAALDEQARTLVRYTLFADEIPLPAGGVEGDPLFKQDFLSPRKPAADETSLRDFDLRTRLFRHRCSYMIYSAPFQSMPPALKERVYAKLGAALDSTKAEPDYRYLPDAEKQAIRRILRETLSDLPKGW